MKYLTLSAAMLACVLGGCTAGSAKPASVATAEKHPEARAYDAAINANAAVDAALANARQSGKLVLIAMGANWCHDSRAFAGWLETPKFQQLIAERYEVVYVNVGMPQTKDCQNLDIAERFGVKTEGTPNVLVLSPNGELLNGDTATTWRNAASRSESDIYEELAGFAAGDAS